jgi:hypothetical protein
MILETPMTAPKTFYEILDLPHDASASDVEAGYTRALEVFSGDSLASYALFTPEEAERARRDIETAYEVLRHSARRSAYDAVLNGAPDKGAATLSFTTTFQMPEQGNTSVSDGSVVPVEPAAERKNPSVVRIALPVEDAAQTRPPEPAPEKPAEPDVTATAELPPMPPPAPVADVPPPLVVPSSVPVSLSPTDPPPAPEPVPPPPPAPVVTAPPAPSPRFKRVRLDDDSTALQVSRPATASVIPTPVAAPEVTPVNQPLPEDGEINGALLQRLREARGITLRVMADTTKLSMHYVKAIEANQFSELPGRVYLRGFLIQYARALRVNPDRLSSGYLAFADRYRTQLK